MSLKIKNLKANVHQCGSCGALLPDWGYECDVCNEYACAACFQKTTIRQAHEHKQPEAKPQPDAKLLQAAAADAKLRLDPSLEGSSSDINENCPIALAAAKKHPEPPQNTDTHCPSCGWERQASSLDTKLRFLKAHNKQPDWYELNSVSASGKEAHCVMSQSVIRDVTQRFLGANVTHPCDAIEDAVWPKVSADYKVLLTIAASAPPPASAKPLARAGTPEGNAQLAVNLKENWKPPTEIALTDDQLPIAHTSLLRRFTGDGSNVPNVTDLTVDGVHANVAEGELKGPAVLRFNYKGQAVVLSVTVTKQDITDPQKKAKGDFLSKFPKERREPAESSLDKDGLLTIVVLVKSADGGEGNHTIFTRTIDRDGSTKSERYQDFQDGKPQEAVDGKKAVAKPARKLFPENVFSNLMRGTLMEGTQCAYCEDLQGAFTLPQRLQLLTDNSDVLPPEFVGLHLLKKITDAGGIGQYMDAWLNKVVAELRVDLERLCAESKAEQAQQSEASSSSSATSSSAKQPAPKKSPATDAEIGLAVGDAIDAMGPEFRSLDVAIEAGKRLSAAGKTGDNNLVKAQIQKQLAAMASAKKIEQAGEAVKGAVPYRRLQK